MSAEILLKPSILHKNNFYMYMLELEDNCFYIGITSRGKPMVRIDEHFSGNGAVWTKIHKPLVLLSLKSLGKITEEEAKLLENSATLKYMELYGYNRVRGGSFSYSGNYVKFGHRYLRTDSPVSHWA
jgi:predicted GIY-YIG superfamily endonuclease